MTILKTLSKQTRQSLTTKRLPNFWLPQPTLDVNCHGIQKLHWEVAVGGDAPFEDIFLVWMAVAIDFTPTTSTLSGPNKIVVMPE